jgi:hypothetical protein
MLGQVELETDTSSGAEFCNDRIVPVTPSAHHCDVVRLGDQFTFT